jgi:hypothetical protein
MFVLCSEPAFYFIFLRQFVRGIYLIQFIIPGRPRIDTFIISCNLQSVEWSVNRSFQEEFVVLVTPSTKQFRKIQGV